MDEQTQRQMENALRGLRNIATGDLDGIDASRIVNARIALQLAIELLAPPVPKSPTVLEAMFPHIQTH